MLARLARLIALAVFVFLIQSFFGVPTLAADKVRSDEWHLDYLQVGKAQSVSEGKGVIVGVVDSGVFPHPDLADNLLAGIDITTGDGNGKSDQVGHGTEMASLIAAGGRARSTGVLGIASQAKILPVRVMSKSNPGGSETIGDGITWAAQHGAKVISVSASIGPSRNMEDGVATARIADALVVAGSGNRSITSRIGYPAALPGVLAVGAIDRSGKHASFSTTGSAVQICAPGEAIIAAEPPDKYVKIDGTSPATAIVSGAAALVRAKFPRLSAQEVIHRLTATATDIGKPGRDDECGYGVLNIVKALTADVPPLQTATTAPTSTPTVVAPTPDSETTVGGSGQASAPTDAGSSSKIVVGIVLVVVMVGGLLAFLLAWRKKKA